uniref:Nudix (nucleoside diphosphate linked moiety X)-type motif 8 n=1 Tax=Neogobius melanostomus TaxID=47308 RepID=A0A8C6U5D3_9GOBI
LSYLCLHNHFSPLLSFRDPRKPNNLCFGHTSTKLFNSVSNASVLTHNQVRQVHHKTVPCEDSAWRECLSSGNEQRCRQILEPNLKLYEVEKARWASVLVSLCSMEDEPAFLFTLRSSTLKGRHKGDVSFAGGKSDPSDKDVVATALREAWEELGINVGAEQVWGVLKPLREMTGMMVAPVLANLGPLEELSFKPNPGEVEEIFTMSLSHLYKYGYTLPVFRNGKHKVWGLTAVALEHTLKIICQQ